MADIIPAILPKNYEDLKNKLSILRGRISFAQIDICDGVFVKNVSWPFLSSNRNDMTDELESNLDFHFVKIMNEEEGMPFWEEIDFEIDLMVSDAIKNFDLYTKLGARRIVFHLDAVGDINEFLNFIEGMDPYTREAIEIGVAINTDVSLEKVYSLINLIDFIQCMGISKIGFQGQEFDERVFENIKTLKEKFPDLVISVDGGVNLELGDRLLQAGVSRLVVGSQIFGAVDVLDSLENFKDLI